MIKYLNKRNILIAAAIIVVILIVFFVNSLANKKEDFMTEKVARGTVAKEISETGTVEANENINLNFKSSGRISGVYVKVGDEVSIGQELAKLDTSDLLIQLRQAETDLKLAKAKSTDAEVSFESANENLKNVEAEAEESINNAYSDALTVLSDCGSKINNAYNIVYGIQQTYFPIYQGSSADVIEAKDSVKSALIKTNDYNNKLKNNYNKTEIDLAIPEIKNALINTGIAIDEIRSIAGSSGFRSVVSSTDVTNLDTQKTYINTGYSNLISAEQAISTAKINAETAINNAEAEVILLQKQTGSAQNGLYLTQIEQANNQVLLLKNQINDAALKSPINGKITAVRKKAGEIVQPNNSFISLLSSGLFQIKVNIYEGDIIDVKEGNPAEITLVSLPDNPLKGVVISVDPAEKLINDIVYYEVTIGFLDFKQGIKQGMTADIVIEVGKKDNVLVVPRRAITKINGDRIVNVYKKGKTEERKIEIGLDGNEYTEIISGLEEGEEIVIGKKI